MIGVRALVPVLCCCLALAISQPAAAAGGAGQGKAAFDQGQRQFLAGNYRDALASFKRGYEVTQDPAFLLNAAQCHRFLDELDEALTMYRLYLKRTPELANREARAVATKAIRELEQQIAGRGAGKGREEAGTTMPLSASAYPVFEPLPEAEAEKAALPPPPPKPSQDPEAIGRRLRLVGLVCGAVGVASVGIGIYYWTRATSLSDSANSATIYNQTDYDDGARAETMQAVFYGVGTAALVAGAALYAYGRWLPAAKKSSVSLAPMVGPGAAGLEAHGAF